MRNRIQNPQDASRLRRGIGRSRLRVHERLLAAGHGMIDGLRDVPLCWTASPGSNRISVASTDRTSAETAFIRREHAHAHAASSWLRADVAHRVQPLLPGLYGRALTVVHEENSLPGGASEAALDRFSHAMLEARAVIHAAREDAQAAVRRANLMVHQYDIALQRWHRRLRAARRNGPVRPAETDIGPEWNTPDQLLLLAFGSVERHPNGPSDVPVADGVTEAAAHPVRRALEILAASTTPAGPDTKGAAA